jgi:hypothetical protein
MSQKYLLVFLLPFLSMSGLARAQENLDDLGSPPPGELYLAAKIDPKRYLGSFGLEGSWAMANPYMRDYTAGLNLSLFPVSWLRTSLHSIWHFSSESGFADRINQHLNLRDKKIRLLLPELDLAASVELRFLHGIGKLFHALSLDYESAIFLRAGKRRYSDGTWAWMLMPGLSQTLLFRAPFNLRVFVGSDIRDYEEGLSLQGAYLGLGGEYRF